MLFNNSTCHKEERVPLLSLLNLTKSYIALEYALAETA